MATNYNSLKGVTADTFSVAGTYTSKYSVLFKNVSGNLRVRNPTDTADATTVRVRARPPAGAAAAGTAPLILPELAAAASTMSMHPTNKVLTCTITGGSYAVLTNRTAIPAGAFVYNDTEGSVTGKNTLVYVNSGTLRIGSTTGAIQADDSTSYRSTCIGTTLNSGSNGQLVIGNNTNTATIIYDSVAVGKNVISAISCRTTVVGRATNQWPANADGVTVGNFTNDVSGWSTCRVTNGCLIGMDMAGYNFADYSPMNVVAIGYGVSIGHSGAILIGAGVASTASGEIRIGDSTNYTALYCDAMYAGSVGVDSRQAYADSSGYWGYVSSSVRYKENIQDYTSNKAFDLEPVVFDYKDSSQGIDQIGFIAESVNELAPEAVCLDNDGLPRSINYADLVPVLTAAIKHMKITLKSLQERLAVLEG
jgi:hypothetical protein